MPKQRSAYFIVPFVTSYAGCNFAKSCNQISLGHTKINFLSRSFDRPTIGERFLKNGTYKAEKVRNLARVLKKKENKKYENNTLRVNFWKYAVRIYARSTKCLCVCSKLHASKGRCELFTIPQSDFRTCFFLFT